MKEGRTMTKKNKENRPRLNIGDSFPHPYDWECWKTLTTIPEVVARYWLDMNDVELVRGKRPLENVDQTPDLVTDNVDVDLRIGGIIVPEEMTKFWLGSRCSPRWKHGVGPSVGENPWESNEWPDRTAVVIDDGEDSGAVMLLYKHGKQVWVFMGCPDQVGKALPGRSVVRMKRKGGTDGV